MPELDMGRRIFEERQSIEKEFKTLYDEEFKGMAPGTRNPNDSEFLAYFEAQLQGIPGQPQVDPLTGMMMPTWESPPRPNMIQLLALAEDGPQELRRYGRLKGKEVEMEILISMFQRMAAEGRKNG